MGHLAARRLEQYRPTIPGLDSSSDQENNWGLYGVADGGFGETRWNLRLGWADALGLGVC